MEISNYTGQVKSQPENNGLNSRSDERAGSAIENPKKTPSIITESIDNPTADPVTFHHDPEISLHQPA
jgi:hypothetical protein